MAKRVAKKPVWIQAPHIVDVYSVSHCVSDDFADYIPYWKHNGYWFFDSPEIIKDVARENAVSLEGTMLFYYEVYEKQFDGEKWNSFGPEPSFVTNLTAPGERSLEGFDVVTFYAGTSPECSPLSCNSMASQMRTNSHCLFSSLEEAENGINAGVFKECEPGPYRIFAVYTVTGSDSLWLLRRPQQNLTHERLRCLRDQCLHSVRHIFRLQHLVRIFSGVRIKLGENRPWTDHRHAYTVLAQFLRDRITQAIQPPLRSSVRGAVRQRILSR